ncbi:MAG TPA: CAAD domain-containing protein [Trichocoleus sp.]
MNTEYKTDSMLPEADTPLLPPETTATTDSETSFPSEGTSQQLQQVWDKVSALLADLPEYVTDFFKEYQRPIITVGLIFASIVSVKLVLAILGAINEIPLLSPTLELIGLTYSGWFIYRYLLRAANRQELVEDINTLKEQVLGKGS